MSIPTIHLLLRITARASGSVFLLALIAPKLRTLWNSSFSRVLDSATTGLLLLFAALHSVHLGFIVALARAKGPDFFALRALPGIVGGGAIYLLIYALAASQLFSGRGVPLLRSRRFQSLAWYVIWAAFAVAYTGSVIPYPAIAPLVLVTYVALGIRIAGLFSHRSTAAAA